MDVRGRLLVIDDARDRGSVRMVDASCLHLVSPKVASRSVPPQKGVVWAHLMAMAMALRNMLCLCMSMHVPILYSIA